MCRKVYNGWCIFVEGEGVKRLLFLGLLAAILGGSAGASPYLRGDVSGDCVVDWRDVQLFAGRWLAGVGGSDANLVAHWKFDEGSGTTAGDSSIYGNDGVVTGAGWVDGQVGGALQFNGTNNYVTVADNAVLSPGKITICAWIKPENVSSDFMIIGKWAKGDLEYWFDNVGNNDALRLYAIFGGVSGPLESDDGVLMAGVWQHVAVTWDGSTGVFYVNGVNAGEDTSKSGDMADWIMLLISGGGRMGGGTSRA